MENNKTSMKILLQLFCSFAKVGVMTFGGGYSMLPLLQNEIVKKQNWTSLDELTDYFSISQCTPGIISVNVSTFIGYKVAGTWGGVFSALGVVFPSIVIILIISSFIQNISSIEIVQHIFAGIRIAVSALILSAVLKLIKSGVKSKLTFVIFISALLLTVFTKISPIIIILAAALSSVFFVKEKTQ